MTTFANPNQINLFPFSDLNENDEWSVFTLASLNIGGLRLATKADSLANPVFKALVKRFIEEINEINKNEATQHEPTIGEVIRMIQVCGHLNDYANSGAQFSIDAAEDLLDNI